MTPVTERLSQLFTNKWSFSSAPSPHFLSCDSSSDSETDSVFDSPEVEDSLCDCYDGCYLPRLKMAAIPPVVATESAAGNFLATSTADSLLLELIGKGDTPAQSHGVPATTSGPAGPAGLDDADCISLAAADALKCREMRVNSDFLRQYALDFSARCQGTLPMSDAMEDMARLTQTPSLKQFDAKFGLARISALSKEKLWLSVVLEPRTDARPQKSIAISKCGNATAAPLRLLQHQLQRLSAGVLLSAKHLHHSSDWCTLSTFTQYTRKGWVSERWTNVS